MIDDFFSQYIKGKGIATSRGFNNLYWKFVFSFLPKIVKCAEESHTKKNPILWGVN